MDPEAWRKLGETMAYIEFKNVKKIYKMGDVKIRALYGMDFKIDKGEFAVLLIDCRRSAEKTAGRGN